MKIFEVSSWDDGSGYFTLWNGKNLVYDGSTENNNPSSNYYYFSMNYESGKKVVQTDKIILWELD